MKRMVMVIIGIAFLVLIAACTQVETVKLDEVLEETITDEYVAEEEKTEEPVVEEEIPPVEEQPGVIEGVVEGNGALKEDLCPEQVLLAIRSCDRFNGFLNISIKNQLENVSMIFYYLYEDMILSEEHSDEVVASKETRSYLINFKEVEEQYGEVRKIEATPVYSKADGSMIACSNKKLPVIVKYSCN